MTRSAAYLGIGDATRALTDAEKCASLAPDRSMGYDDTMIVYVCGSVNFKRLQRCVSDYGTTCAFLL